MLHDSELLNSLRHGETINLIAARWALVCKSKLIQGFNLDNLIAFLRVVDAVVDVEEVKVTNTVSSDLRAHHASLLHHMLAILIEPMTEVDRLSLGQQGELTTAIDQLAHQVATHMIGINPSSVFWTRILQ